MQKKEEAQEQGRGAGQTDWAPVGSTQQVMGREKHMNTGLGLQRHVCIQPLT